MYNIGVVKRWTSKCSSLYGFKKFSWYNNILIESIWPSCTVSILHKLIPGVYLDCVVYVHIVMYYQVGGVTHQQIAVYDLSCTVSLLGKLIPGVYLDCVVYVHIVIYYQVGGVTHQQIAVYDLSCTVSLLGKLIPGVYLDCVVYVHIVIYYQVGGVTHQQIAVYDRHVQYHYYVN